jgi:hypothetical protein
VELQHLIQVTKTGLIIVTEQINLLNNQTEPLTNFLIGFHHNFTIFLDDAIAMNSTGEKLMVEEMGVDPLTNIYWLDVKFPVPIEPNMEHTFSITFIFSKLITFKELNGSLVYTVTLPQYPALPFSASTCVVEINLSTELTFLESTWENSTTQVKSPLPANFNQTGAVSFQGPLLYVECDSLERTITIDSGGGIVFKDHYTIRNIGAETIRELDFPIIRNARHVIAYDALGSLAPPNVLEEEEVMIASATFRYPLRGEDIIQYHDAYSFTLQYNLQNQEYIIQTNPLSIHQFRVELLPSSDWTINKYQTKIILPEGASNLEVSPTPTEISQHLFTQSISYDTQVFTPYQTSLITIKYDYNIFWSALRPTLWVGIICTIVSGIVLLSRKKKPKAPPIQSKQFTIIQPFVEVLEERMSLWIELDTLENDMDTRSIRRKAYNRRRRILIQRLSVLNKELNNLGNNLSRIKREYATSIERMRKAETEIHTLYSENNKLRNQWRRGKISRNEYRKLKDTHNTRIQNSKKVIDNVLIFFRDEL